MKFCCVSKGEMLGYRHGYAETVDDHDVSSFDMHRLLTAGIYSPGSQNATKNKGGFVYADYKKIY